MKKSLLMLSLISVLTMSSNSQSNGWSLQPGPISQNLNGVSFSDANIWIAVGNAGSIIRSSNGGINWNVISSPVTDDLHSVCMHGSIGLAVGTGGRVVRTTNSGMSWVEITRPTTRMLNSVSISDMMAV